MGTPFDDLQTVHSRYEYASTDDQAYAMGKCPNCDAHQFAVLAVTQTPGRAWLRCMNCKIALVVNGEQVSPPPMPLRVPSGVKDDELRAWQEIRLCLGVGANTAAVMLCRKLLMHVAVAHGLPDKNAKGRAPDFTECVNHLVSEGIVTKRMEPWVDRIREVGNEANHEIVPVTKETATDVATFTQKLLELAYEMDDTMAKALPTTPPAALGSV